MARPKKECFEKRDKMVGVLMTEEVYDALKARCRSKHRSMSSLMEELAIKYIEEDKFDRFGKPYYIPTPEDIYYQEHGYEEENDEESDEDW